MVVSLIPSIEPWLTEILLGWGYPGIIFLIALETLVPPLPSEVILALAGFQVARGELSFPLTLLAATTGSLAGALMLYGLGFWYGPRRLRSLIRRYGGYALIDLADLDRAEHWFIRNGAAAVFLARLVPGVRSLISLPAGLTHMPLPTFIALTLAGSAIWNGALIGLGWLLKEQWGTVGNFAPLIEAAILMLTVGYFMRIIWRRRRRARRQPPRRGSLPS